MTDVDDCLSLKDFINNDCCLKNNSEM